MRHEQYKRHWYLKKMQNMDVDALPKRTLRVCLDITYFAETEN